jgi:two-component system OmpR family response regulator
MRILLVEDDRVLRDVMVRSLGEAGHRVDVAETVEQAEHFWRVQMFDAVLLDLNLPLSARPHSGLGSGLRPAARARARAATARRCWCSPRATAPRSASPAWTPAPTTTWASRSTWPRWRRGCARWCAAPRAPTTWCSLGQLRLDRKRGAAWRCSGASPGPARARVRGAVGADDAGRPRGQQAHAVDKLSEGDDLLGDNALEAFISRLRKQLQGSGRAHPHPARAGLCAGGRP